MTAATTEKTRADWLAWRRTGIGGSDIAAIVGLGRWGSPYSVWADKVGLLDDTDDEPNDAQDFGKHFEAMAAPWFHERTGLHVVGEQLWASHRNHRWMICTPDGFADERPDAPVEDCTAIVEWKVTTDKPYDSPEQIPAHFLCQAQWNMAVTSTDACYLGVLHWRRFRVYEVRRDEADIDYLTVEADRFWHDYVVPQVPPPLDGSPFTADALDRIHRHGTIGTQVQLDDIAPTLTALRAVKAEAKQLAEHQRALEAVVKVALGDAEVGTVRGVPAVTWRAAKAVDAPALVAAHPDECAPFMRLDLTAFGEGKGAAERKRLAEEFRTIDASRRLLVKDQKETT